MPQAQVSADCADLIGRMLMPDPAKRITVRQIMRHPWVAAGMPAQLARINATLISGARACCLSPSVAVCLPVIAQSRHRLEMTGLKCVWQRTGCRTHRAVDLRLLKKKTQQKKLLWVC